MRTRVMLDSFSGPAADLKGRARTETNVLLALSKVPRVSTWDMDAAWLRHRINRLVLGGLIREEQEPYPWCRYSITDLGRAAIANATGSAQAAGSTQTGERGGV